MSFGKLITLAFAVIILNRTLARGTLQDVLGDAKAVWGIIWGEIVRLFSAG